MEKDRFKELCFQYFLNRINEEDYNELKKAFDSGDDDLKKIFLEIKNIVSHLPLAAEIIEPSPEIKKKIMNSIKAEGVKDKSLVEVPIKKKLNTIEKFAGYLWLDKPGFALLITTVFIAVIVSLVVYIFNLDEKIITQQKKITRLENEAEKNKELLGILTSKEIEVVIMDGLEVNPSGYGKIIWDPNRKSAILQVSNLPPADKGKDYQLWVIRDNKPISAGVFNVEKRDENFYKIENLAEVNKEQINAFAVTLEPKGGLPQPTGKMFLLGKPAL